ncbi:MAG: hypothetical protein CMJ24_11395 [Phycisphaerae bacterium]|nr:hypothetical protein [Phycisphaerae bacterium]MDG1898415.1 PEGA domain-containing protein [Phycisphaerales bacterium]|tara:strand:+ start:2788 stop:3285 length:498 start_codon:yes stop_codon:yes gene_type:complete
MNRFIFTSLLAAMCLSTIGCVRRTLRIDSTPQGALVWVNHREVGRTPLEIDFTYYGHYDIELSLDGHEPMITDADADPPVWDIIGLDLLFEVAPFQSHSVVDWHFDLEPRSDDLGALVTRAREMRTRSKSSDHPMSKITVDAEGRIEGDSTIPDEPSKRDDAALE